MIKISEKLFLNFGTIQNFTLLKPDNLRHNTMLMLLQFLGKFSKIVVTELHPEENLFSTRYTKLKVTNFVNKFKKVLETKHPQKTYFLLGVPKLNFPKHLNKRWQLSE